MGRGGKEGIRKVKGPDQTKGKRAEREKKAKERKWPNRGKGNKPDKKTCQ